MFWTLWQSPLVLCAYSPTSHPEQRRWEYYFPQGPSSPLLYRISLQSLEGHELYQLTQILQLEGTQENAEVL